MQKDFIQSYVKEKTPTDQVIKTKVSYVWF